MQARTTPVEGALLPLPYFHTSTWAAGDSGQGLAMAMRRCRAQW